MEYIHTISSSFPVRSWDKFASANEFSRPSMSEVPTRIQRNVLFFAGNYGIVFSLIVILAIFLNPLILVPLGILIGGWLYVSTKHQTEPLVVGSVELSKEKLYAILFVLTGLIFFFTSVGGTIFWILGLALTAIGVHASLKNPPTDDELATAAAERTESMAREMKTMTRNSPTDRLNDVV